MQIPKPNDKEFEIAPAGTHKAVCYRVIDLGTQDVVYEGQTKKQHQIMVSWELPEELMSDGRPFAVMRRYTWSMSDKAALRGDLESWRGVPFTEKDFGEGGFDIKNIIGKPCLLTVIHREGGKGKTYANVKSISKILKGMEVPPPKNEPIYLWLHPSRWNEATFQKLSEHIQGTIMKSPEYKALANGHDEQPPADDEFPSEDIPF